MTEAPTSITFFDFMTSLMGFCTKLNKQITHVHIREADGVVHATATGGLAQLVMHSTVPVDDYPIGAVMCLNTSGMIKSVVASNLFDNTTKLKVDTRTIRDKEVASSLTFTKKGTSKVTVPAVNPFRNIGTIAMPKKIDVPDWGMEIFLTADTLDVIRQHARIQKTIKAVSKFPTVTITNGDVLMASFAGERDDAHAILECPVTGDIPDVTVNTDTLVAALQAMPANADVAISVGRRSNGKKELIMKVGATTGIAHVEVYAREWARGTESAT